jgi:hypothetical protein
MTQETDDKRAQRLAQARAFLAAGKTQIDPAPPAAQPADAGDAGKRDDDTAPRPDPTRFGDWEKNGRCIDF